MTTFRNGSTPLTPRQRQVLDFIVAFVDRSGYPPTLREIARHLKVSGPLPVSKHLDALEKKGFLRRDPVSRGISLSCSPVRPLSLPIVGTVRAGQLAPALEDIQGDFAIDRQSGAGDDGFFLKVAGDSMIDAGILDGDLALVRPQPTADNGDIVVAMVDNEATLKRFYREADRIRLQPANAAMAPIIVAAGEGEVTLIGLVIGIYRPLE